MEGVLRVGTVAKKIINKLIFFYTRKKDADRVRPVAHWGNAQPQAGVHDPTVSPTR